MPKEEWGVKRVCPTTGKRFYDLGRTPIVSPYTGEVVELDTGRGGRSLVADKSAKRSKEKETEDEDLVLDDDLDIDDDDTSDVELDDDDVLEDDDEGDTVALDDLADVASDDDES
ncbi:MAG: TIGR02300 family protein [Roseicyclus sp.]